jgi:metal-responsive CopG/Arc/MetJ family transcriptional regulator
VSALLDQLRAMHPKVARITVSLDPKLLEWVRQVAREADVPVSTVVQLAVRQYREAHDGE